jgi:hypothetical protein
VLIVVALLVVGGAAWVMFDMDASSRSQGGRFYVAVGALVLLGVLDRLAGGRRDQALASLVVMLLAAVVLVGLALWLPSP